MKKSINGLFLFITLLAGVLMFSGCIKNGTTRTLNPYMTATIGAYTFSAEYTYSATDNPQLTDTGTTLIITGSLPNTHEVIQLTINNYTGKQGVYSMVEGQASGKYTHGGILSIASGGVVAITKMTSNSIIGYFSFNTYDGYNVLSGTYNVGIPY